SLCRCSPPRVSLPVLSPSRLSAGALPLVSLCRCSPPRVSLFVLPLTSFGFLLEMEYGKGLQKLVNTYRGSLNQEAHMPFQSIYSVALEQDLDHGHGVLHTAGTLQHQTFLQVYTYSTYM
ncbi:hypothetical protein FKM82_030671, partial [Ascaphus truei]